MANAEDCSKSNPNRPQPIKYLTYNQKEDRIEIIERNSSNISSITGSSMPSGSMKSTKIGAQSLHQTKPSTATVQAKTKTSIRTGVSSLTFVPGYNQSDVVIKQPTKEMESSKEGTRKVKFAAPPSDWTERPADIPEKCSPDLGCLLIVDHIFIKPQKEPYTLGATTYEIAQVYQILNLRSEILFLALEESNPCCRLLRGPDRAFVMHLVDYKNNEIITLYRSCQCFSNALCLPSYIRVESPPGVVLGTFEEKFDFLRDVFVLKLTPSYGKSTIRIEKSIFQCLYEPVQLKVINIEKKTECGRIKKPWSGRGDKWYHNDNEIIGINFPPSTDVNSKALLIAGLFLTELIYY